MSEPIDWNAEAPDRRYTLPGYKPPKPTLAELRAKVTEAEAAFGRAYLNANPPPRVWSGANSLCLSAAGANAEAARAALRQAEEAERKPRLASVGEIQRQAGRRAIADWDTALIAETRADMLAVMRRLPPMMAGRNMPTAGSWTVISAAVLLSDIEALVREAGE